MTISAWYMDDVDSDQRLPHRAETDEVVTTDKLVSLGLISFSGINSPGLYLTFRTSRLIFTVYALFR